MSELNFVVKIFGIYHSVIRDFCVLSTGVYAFNFVTEMPVACKDQSLRRVVKCGSAVLSVEENRLCSVDEKREF